MKNNDRVHQTSKITHNPIETCNKNIFESSSSGYFTRQFSLNFGCFNSGINSDNEPYSGFYQKIISEYIEHMSGYIVEIATKVKITSDREVAL